MGLLLALLQKSDPDEPSIIHSQLDIRPTEPTWGHQKEAVNHLMKLWQQVDYYLLEQE